MSAIRIALDIDGTIDGHVMFFAALTRCPEFEVHIVSGRDPADRALTLRDLAGFGIRYTKLHFADRWEDKARICRQLGAAVFFEDQDEYIGPVAEGTLVFKARNGGNFDFEGRRWET